MAFRKVSCCEDFDEQDSLQTVEQPHVLLVEEGGMSPIEAEIAGVATTLYVKEPDSITLFQGDFTGQCSSYSLALNTIRNYRSDYRLTIRISSDGGSVSQLCNLIGLIDEIGRDGVTTVIDGNAYSAGAMAFMLGSERIIHETDEMLVHDIQTVCEGPRSNISTRISFLKDKANKILSKTYGGYLTAEDMCIINSGGDLSLNAEDMAYRGIATHVYVDGRMLTSEEYLDYITSGESVEELFDK